MVRFSMMRHGKTSWNMEKKIQGRTDIPLSNFGQEQVGCWAKVIKKETFDFIVSSPMKRAEQTSWIIGKVLNLDIQVEKDLIEQDFGLWEGKTLKKIYEKWPGTEQQMISQGLDFCPPEGESKRSVRKRALCVLKKYAGQSSGKRILVISHNGLMKSIIYPIIKRERLPLDKKILKDDHLHLLSLKSIGKLSEKSLGKNSLFGEIELSVDKINALKLTGKR